MTVASCPGINNRYQHRDRKTYHEIIVQLHHAGFMSIDLIPRTLGMQKSFHPTFQALAILLDLLDVRAYNIQLTNTAG